MSVKKPWRDVRCRGSDGLTHYAYLPHPGRDLFGEMVTIMSATAVITCLWCVARELYRLQYGVT